MMQLLSLKEYITEAVSNSQVESVAEIIRKYLNKKTGIKFIKMPGIEYFTNTYIKNGCGIRYFYDVNKSVRFNFIGTSIKSSKLHSIDIWTGKTKYPNFYLEFPKEVSMIKIVPSLVSFILNPHSGKIELIPNSKSLNEDIKFSKFLLESAKLEKYTNAFDDVLTILNSGEPFSFNELPKQYQTNAQWKIIDFIKKNFAGEFEKRGNRIYFSGDKSTIEKARENIIEGAGGFSVNVKIGSSSETYRLSKKHEESLPSEERIPFKDQIKDLEHLTKLLIAGASQSLIIAGKGGTGKCIGINSNLTIYKKGDTDVANFAQAATI